MLHLTILQLAIESFNRKPENALKSIHISLFYILPFATK